jgi:ankyrin repeat protein
MGRTELHHAAADGDLKKVEALIASGADVSLADDNQWTPLHFAAQAASEPVAAALLKAGATVDPRDSHGNSPLFKAVFSFRGDGGLIPLLRQHGADPSLKNLHGISPLTLARQIANTSVAELFADLPFLETDETA